MATNYVQSLEERKKKAEQASQSYGDTVVSLTDRLNQYDQYRGGTASNQIFGPQGNMENRPKGYNPTKSLAAWFNLIAGRQGLESDIESARTGQRQAESDITNILGKLYDISQANQPEPPKPTAEQLFNQGYTYDLENNKWTAPDGSITTDPVVDSYVTQLKNGSLKIENVPADYRNKVVKALSNQGINLEQETRNVEKDKITGIVKNLEGVYNRGTDTERDDLSGGRVVGTLGSWLAKSNLLGYANTDVGSDISTYNNMRDALVTTLKQLVGESGVLTNQDVQRIQKLLPKVTSTKAEAKKAWEEIYDFIEEKYGSSVSSNTQMQSFPSGQMQSVPGQNDPLGIL